jgi:hypothetical protein
MYTCVDYTPAGQDIVVNLYKHKGLIEVWTRSRESLFLTIIKEIIVLLMSKVNIIRLSWNCAFLVRRLI